MAFIAVAAAAALGAIAYTLHVLRTAAETNIASLLPTDTIAFVHVPDFDRAYNEWQHCDIYQLFREPAVQDFLPKPASRSRRRQRLSRNLQELQQLGAHDIFVALTSIEPRNIGFVAGFRFRAKRDAADAITRAGRTQLLGKQASPNTQKITYRDHEIEVAAAPTLTLATVYDGRWFFASNDVEKLKQLLDRADRGGSAAPNRPNTAQDRQSTLASNEVYRAALVHMPRAYAAMFYLQPKVLRERLSLLATALGLQIPPEQSANLTNISSFCGTTAFENGKIHEVLFSGMPEMAPGARLTRSSLALTTQDTGLYLATLFDPEKANAAGEIAAAPLGRWLEKFLRVVSSKGVTAAEWKAAFGLEIASLIDWPASVHWPSLVATVPVKDAARARKITEAVTGAIDEDAHWMRSERDGVVYFSMATPSPLFAVTPTIALSDRILVAGLDAAAVEAAINRGAHAADGLSRSQTYKNAARSLPEPASFFSYIDTALLYSRADATLRPVLLLGAAFLPAFSEHLNFDKLPAVETVTKHLSPIVSSQRYERDGYVAESIGPITSSEAVVVAAVLIHSALARQPAH